MAKQCGFDGCPFDVYSHGYCQRHQSARTDQKRIDAVKAANNRNSAKRIKTGVATVRQKPSKPIAKNSEKRAYINRNIYEPSAKAHRLEIGHCQVCPVIAGAGIDPGFKCCGEPQSIHHIKGKQTIELLLDKRFWLVSCFLGNNWIEANSKIAERLKLKLPDYNSKLSKFKKT